MALIDDHNTLQADDGDTNTRQEELQNFLRPDDDFSPTIQMWYDRIHAYLQLIRMKEGRMSNRGIFYALQDGSTSITQRG
jgi:hypothetical protein